MSASRVARAGLQTIGGTGVQMLVQVISLMVLARLLEPRAFGVYGLAMVVVGFTSLFRDLGLSSAAVQARDMPRQLRNNLWWINTLVGLGLTVATAALAPLAGAFFREPDVTQVMLLLSPTLLLAGAAVQHRATLMRDMRFGAATALDVGGAVVGLVLAVIIASAGGGVWALVVPQLVTGVIVLVGTVLVARWWPGLPRRGHGTRVLAQFGGSILLSQFLTYVHRNFDATLIGRLHGVQWTGQFNRATQLTRMPIGMLAGPFGKVALATMARHQDDHAALAGLARKGQVLLALPVLAAAGGLVAAAEPLVAIVLGPGWGPAVPFVALIAASEALALMSSVGGWILTARGQGRKLIRLSVISTVTKLSLASVGALWGPYGIVAGVLASQVLLWPLSLTLVARMTGLDLRSILADSYLLVGVVGTATAGAWGVLQLVTPPGGPLTAVALAAAVMLAILGLAAAVLAPFRRDLAVFFTTVRSGLGRG